MGWVPRSFSIEIERKRYAQPTPNCSEMPSNFHLTKKTCDPTGGKMIKKSKQKE